MPSIFLRRGSRARLVQFVAASALLSAHGRLALAQASTATSVTATGGGSADVGLEEVVVTAQRRTTKLKDTPIAISAFGATALRDRQIESVRDLAGQVPNLNVQRATISYTTQTFSLRGVGESDPIQEPVLAVYVDDVYSPRQIGAMLDFNDVERIEVLRGPQGTLYGRNSSAGALRVITHDPDDTAHAAAEATYGSYDEFDVRASASGPIVVGKLDGGLVYIHHERDGTSYDPTLGKHVNAIDLDGLRGKLRWRPLEPWDILLTVSALRDRSDAHAYTPINQPGGDFHAYRSYSEVDPKQDLDQITGSLRIKYAIDPHLSLKSISAYGGFNLDPVSYDNDGQAALIQKNLIHYNDQYYTQELQLNGDYGRLNFTSGFFYLHERFYVQRDGYTRLGPLATSPVSALRAHNRTNTDSYALFGEATFKVTDKLSVVGGLRGTLEKKDFRFNNKVLDSATGAVVGQSIQGDPHKTWHSVTPKAVIQYAFNPDATGYVSYSRGFKSGGFDNRATRLDLAELPFDPEKVSTYETGLKFEALNRRLSANLAAFYNDYRDLQVSFFDPEYQNSRRGNAGKARTYGVEAEAQAALTANLSLHASAGYLNSRYQDYKGAGGAGVDADGNELLNAPKWTLSGGAVWNASLGSAGDLRLSGEVQYQSRSYSGALNRSQDVVPKQTYVDAAAAWTLPDARWSITVAAKNLFDTHKWASVTYNPSTAVYYRNYADPRTVQATLRYAF